MILSRLISSIPTTPVAWSRFGFVISPAVRAITSGNARMSKYYLVTYTYVPNVVEKRAPLRESHLKLAQQYVSEGKLLLGGAFADPVDAACIVFKTESKEEVEKFVKADPYVVNGIVTNWTIRDWTVVVGSLQDTK